MDKKVLFCTFSALIILSGCNVEKKFDKASLKDNLDKFSYSMGYSIGKNSKAQSMNVNPDIIKQAIKDGMSGTEGLLNEKEMKDAMESIQKDMMAKQMETAKKAGETNKKEGVDFLAKKKAEKDVVALPSGLLYKITKEGTGKSPKLTDKVTVNYRGKLISGKEFDSSFKRNAPATFPLSGVIKGWQEGMQKIKEGGKAELYVPAELAYGDHAPPEIGPGATLIFEVELIKVN